MTTLFHCKRDQLADLLLEGGCREREVWDALPGLVSLDAGTFWAQGFSEQHQLIAALQKLFERGCQEAPFPFLKMLHTLFRDTGEDRRASHGIIPRAFIAKILDIVREDPFPRIRHGAVRVLMRLGEPQMLGTSLDDYLIGLQDMEALSACTVLNFIIEHFGPETLKEIVCHLNDQQAALPVSLLRLIEAVSEEHLKGLDITWALIQLKNQRGRKKQESRKDERRRELDFISSLDKLQYARLTNCPRREGGSGFMGKAVGLSKTPRKAAKKDPDESRIPRELAERLIRIRSQRVLPLQRRD